MVSSLLERAAVYREMGRLGDARTSFDLAQSIAAEKFDKGDRRHALLLLERGRLELAAGGSSDAERDLTAAVASLRQQDDPAKLAEAMASLGDALIATAKPADARAVLTESLELRRKVLPAGHRAILDGETRLAKMQPQPAS
jgi:tetratricopeptide (TPR) repeat protein